MQHVALTGAVGNNEVSPQSKNSNRRGGSRVKNRDGGHILSNGVGNNRFEIANPEHSSCFHRETAGLA